MKKYKSTIILTNAIILLTIVAGLLLWNQLPDTIATHFGANNQADGWSSKAFAVFGLPLIMLAAHGICIFATLNDPKRANINDKVMTLILWIVPILSIIVMSQVYIIALGHTVNVGITSNLLIGMIFIVIGNYLPKCRQSYTIGIKIPWTLNSVENWNKTHRMAGFLWIIGGFLYLISTFFTTFWGLFPIILILTLIPAGYSYYLFKKGI